MDIAGDAVSRALAALTEAPTPAKAYDTIGSLLREASNNRTLANEADLQQAVRRAAAWAPMQHGDSVDDVVEDVIAWAMTELHLQGRYSDEEHIRRAAVPWIKLRISREAVGDYRHVISGF